MNYATLTEAHIYFAQERLHSELWFEVDDLDKTRALAQATRAMERLSYAGEKTDPNQELEFPRGGDEEIPTPIMHACLECAFAFLSGVDIEYEDDNRGKTSASFGRVGSRQEPSMFEVAKLNGIPSSVAWRLLLPFLNTNRSVILSRTD